MINELTSLIQSANPWVLTALIMAMFTGSLAVVPWLVVRLPHDYFLEEERERSLISGKFSTVRVFVLILKNVLGVVLVTIGIMMLVLPGQGLLTILIGLIMINFPGKYQAERWLVSRKPVLTSINWLRLKYGRKTLLIEKESK